MIQFFLGEVEHVLLMKPRAQRVFTKEKKRGRRELMSKVLLNVLRTESKPSNMS